MEHITNGIKSHMRAGGVLVGAAACWAMLCSPKPAACDGSGFKKSMVLL